MSAPHIVDLAINEHIKDSASDEDYRIRPIGVLIAVSTAVQCLVALEDDYAPEVSFLE
jgi:hypothetical protein